MKKLLIICWLLVSSFALADQAFLKVTPAANLERGLTVVQGQSLVFRVSPGLTDLQTVTLNITRGGKPVGEYAMKKDGTDYVLKLKLELPYAHVVTVRLFQAKRVWVSALDLTVLEPEDQRTVPSTSSVNQELDFTASGGSQTSEINPLWGIAALLVLVAAVFIGTRGKKKVIPNA